ncbi:transposase [Saccharothrix longispora]|uniref:Transposase IS4-like domain-containing protein n=1 Tax=Saccharothrix longispora TaxID=33920 RepID=A0ABU1Q656_9PSEU|nr:transposase [Saccharothrix longispora]MDR6598385.1 hypothetical protein [Saccharothrix longispora]
MGRSRGGWTNKLHLACEQGCRPLSLLVTAGQRGDSPQFTPVIERIAVPRHGGGWARTRPDRVLADKAYSSKANRAYLRDRGIKATIDQPRDQAPTARPKAPTVDGHPPSTRRSTSNAMPSSAVSTCSNSTVAGTALYVLHTPGRALRVLLPRAGRGCHLHR